MGQEFSNTDLNRIARSVKFTERVSRIRADQHVRRGQATHDDGTGQYAGMSKMTVTQNQDGWSYLFAHELL